MHSFDFGETALGSGQCVGTLAGQNLGLGNNTWLLGDRYVARCPLWPHVCYVAVARLTGLNNSFMKNVYSVFSFHKGAVGFATLK